MEYIVLHDIYLPSKNGSSVQIDHMILSIYGIFVVETKNYKGWIFGDDQSRQWKQVK
ncbi:nuclease-related domain-containing protein [Falsibacillus albus]|uniref:NERD domain-containing protein n=1 Tax=Falsibacillus albus TaxID=2478915 RepID=A0A3L7K226_9BACI|nr:NERD domain-containing protein [Falsibacillus albus]